VLEKFGGRTRTRTLDPLIKSLKIGIFASFLPIEKSQKSAISTFLVFFFRSGCFPSV
jgi:hypothetical protein